MSSGKNYVWLSVFVQFYVFIKGHEKDPIAHAYNVIKRFPVPMNEEEKSKSTSMIRASFLKYVEETVLAIENFERVISEDAVTASIPEGIAQMYEERYQGKIKVDAEEKKKIEKRPQLTLVNNDTASSENPSQAPAEPDGDTTQ